MPCMHVYVHDDSLYFTVLLFVAVVIYRHGN